MHQFWHVLGDQASYLGTALLEYCLETENIGDVLSNEVLIGGIALPLRCANFGSLVPGFEHLVQFSIFLCHGFFVKSSLFLEVVVEYKVQIIAQNCLSFLVCQENVLT
jgi:hypothetical protein